MTLDSVTRPASPDARRMRGSHNMFRRTVVVAVTVVMALSIAACGSSRKGGSDTASASLPGPPMRIGVICSCSGFLASSTADYQPVINAWAKWVTDNGGINGHPVKVSFKDDTGDAGTALKAAQSLVQESHVQAIIDLSNQDQAFQKYVEKAGVPVTGGQSYSGPMGASSAFFPTGGGNIPALGYGQAVLAKQRGKTKFAVLVCAESPICGSFTTPFATSLKDVVGGMSLVYSAKITGNAPNYAAQCLAAKEAGAEAMFIGESATVAQRVLDNCAQQGVKLAWFVSGGTPTSNVVKDPNASGMVIPQYNLPVFDKSTPGGKLFNEIVAKYDPSIVSNSAWNDSVIWPFAGLQLFRVAATTQKLSPSSTPADVMSGLYALKDETLGGIAPPLSYAKGKPTSINCWFEEQIVKGKGTLPSGTAPQCVPAETVAALYKAFGAS
jgi:branched-chain amino acid transport system substrate-binding protein